MTRPGKIISLVILFCLVSLQDAAAQGYDPPLTIQGMDRNTLPSAASRAAGGTTIGFGNDVSMMFMNPALLHSLAGIQLSLGGARHDVRGEQVQHYTPLKYYSNFSLLMEGLTGYIPNPDTTRPGVNPGDTVQRPYDKIGPNWSRSKDRNVPLQVMLGVPFTIGEKKVAVGFGFVEYADLNYYYQNNNVLTPAIGSERPFPIPRPSNDSIPVRTQWYQYFQNREGVIRGYGGAISGELSDKFSVGISGMVVKGTSDDFEQHVGRGKLTFFANFFRLDSLKRRVTQTGTSDYSGTEFTFSGLYKMKFVTFGFSVKPPSTITRKYTKQIQFDSTNTSLVSTLSGEDKTRLPWRGTAGLSIAALENFTIGFEYEMRPYASAMYQKSDGTESEPWLSSSILHVGAVFKPTEWLALRAGIRGQAEVFESTGNALVGEPVSFTTYSAGCGILFQGVRLGLTYEYGLLKYQDIWQTNVNFNSEKRHTFIADVSYEVPWGR